MTNIIYKPLRYRKRWFAYLDLLGFTNLVQTESIEHVLPVYTEALDRMRQACKLGKSKVGLLNSWFSDTFIIYTGSDSPENFTHLESAARNFFQLLIIKGIPVRGCISHGELYSQVRQNIFIGPALIDAHKYGEALDWVGFCLSPSVERNLKHELSIEKLSFYRKLTNRAVLRDLDESYIYTYAFNNGTINGKNPFIKPLNKMKALAPEPFKYKYDHTLEFIENT